MPFTKTRSGDYVSPSGRKFTGKQVALYYATNGFKKKPAADRITDKDSQPRAVTPATKAAATRYAKAAMARQKASKMWH